MKSRTVIEYIASDGAVFRNEREAAQHERLAEKVRDIMAPLGSVPRDPDCLFANGHGYLPHALAVTMDVKRQLVKLAGTFHEWFRKHNADEIHPLSFAGRLLSEAGPSLIRAAWGRLACIDVDGREWGQPYYATHPNEGKAFAWDRHGETWRNPSRK